MRLSTATPDEPRVEEACRESELHEHRNTLFHNNKMQFNQNMPNDLHNRPILFCCQSDPFRLSVVAVLRGAYHLQGLCYLRLFRCSRIRSCSW